MYLHGFTNPRAAFHYYLALAGNYRRRAAVGRPWVSWSDLCEARRYLARAQDVRRGML